MNHSENALPPLMEEEVTATEAQHPMETELAEAFAFRTLEHGQILDGTIVSITPTEILIDVGTKTEGIVPSRELEQLGPEYLSSLKVGDEVLAYVVRPEDRQGNPILSLIRAQQEQDWREAERLYKNQEIFERKVIGCNRGGLIVDMGRVRGFAPGSQLSVEHHRVRSPDAKGANRWAHLVGQQLLFKIIELDRHRNRLILSERLAMEEWRRQQKEQLLNELRKGDIRKGVVTSLTDFGAFVDLGGADGLIHLSELSWGPVQHPSEVLEVGQEVEVYILKVDRERKRIGLSLRRLQPEPWSVVHENYAVGQLVEGTITKLTDFGAFARVGPGIEGLIHISELADHRVNHPREVVSVGDVLTLRIIRIEPRRRRMALSLKQVPEDRYVEFDWREEYPGEELAGATIIVEPEAGLIAEAVGAEPAPVEEPEAEVKPPAPEEEAVEPVAEAVEAEPAPVEEPEAEVKPSAPEEEAVEPVAEAVSAEPAPVEEPEAEVEPPAPEEEAVEPVAEAVEAEPAPIEEAEAEAELADLEEGEAAAPAAEVVEAEPVTVEEAEAEPAVPEEGEEAGEVAAEAVEDVPVAEAVEADIFSEPEQ